MLEQTKDTITVPAAFMIRMLACIHSLRNRERAGATTAAAANLNQNGNSTDASSQEDEVNSS